MSRARTLFREGLLHNLGLRISGAALVLFAIAAIVAWRLLPPPLPDVVRLGTGPVGGHYAHFGEALRQEVAEVAEHGVRLELVATAGSPENIRRLLTGEIDVGLVQSGNLSDADARRLVSVATVFYEPVLVVERAEWEAEHGNNVDGGRIAIGIPGSGAHRLASELLADQGITEGIPPGTRLVEIGDARAVQALLDGAVDSGVFVTSLELPWVRTLFADPGLRVTDFALAEAFTRHYRYLERVVIPAGLLDLRAEIPPQDVEVIATTASLVIRPDTHRALIPLLIESAREQLYQGGLLAGPAEFPSPHSVEAPLADEALQYFEQGPSFFYRWLPFRYAFAATRLTILLIPLLTLMYPLVRSLQPTVRWAIRRRVYRFYRVLRTLEAQMDASGDAEGLAQIRAELDRVGEEIRNTHVPASYGASLFALRAHHRLLVDRLEALQQAGRES
jgi:TRAP transporter TAXI family solute receptor